MLTGKELGAALVAAIALKGVSKTAVAAAFNVKPQSVQDWVKFGRISKTHIPQLLDYFSDVVGPEHWGLSVANQQAVGSKVLKHPRLGGSTDPQILRVIELMESMSADQRQRVLDFAQGVGGAAITKSRKPTGTGS